MKYTAGFPGKPRENYGSVVYPVPVEGTVSAGSGTVGGKSYPRYIRGKP